jgi:hypothetical protein
MLSPFWRTAEERFRKKLHNKIEKRAGHTYTLPNATGDRPLELLKALDQWPVTSGGDAMALLRAARLYQDALWLVESESSLAWLMMVSALESAAVQWRKANGTPLDRLQASNEKLYEYLQALHPNAPGIVARHIIDSLGVPLTPYQLWLWSS